MSKLVRVLILGAMLAAMNLAGMTAAHAQPTTGDHASTRHRALGQLEVLAAQGAVAAQEQPTDALARFRQIERASQDQLTTDARQRALAQERYYSTWRDGDPARERALVQERYYSTWGYSNTPAPAPAKPSGQPDWLLPGLGVLAAAVALATGLAVLAAKRTRRRVRVGQAA
jgi:hypothetical protein